MQQTATYIHLLKTTRKGKKKEEEKILLVIHKAKD